MFTFLRPQYMLYFLQQTSTSTLIRHTYRPQNNNNLKTAMPLFIVQFFDYWQSKHLKKQFKMLILLPKNIFSSYLQQSTTIYFTQHKHSFTNIHLAKFSKAHQTKQKVACKRWSSVNSGAWLWRFDDVTGVKKSCVAKAKKWSKNVVSLQLNMCFPKHRMHGS